MGTRLSSYYAHCSLRKEGGQPLHPGPCALPGVRGHLLPRQRRRVLRRLAPCPPPVGLLLQPPLSSLSLRVDGAGILPTCPSVFWGVQHDRLRLNDGIEGACGFPFPVSQPFLLTFLTLKGAVKPF